MATPWGAGGMHFEVGPGENFWTFHDLAATQRNQRKNIDYKLWKALLLGVLRCPSIGCTGEGQRVTASSKVPQDFKLENCAPQCDRAGAHWSMRSGAAGRQVGAVQDGNNEWVGLGVVGWGYNGRCRNETQPSRSQKVPKFCKSHSKKLWGFASFSSLAIHMKNWSTGQPEHPS